MSDYKITRINKEMIALTEDLNLTPTALKEGTIMLETLIAELPEVKTLRASDSVIDVGAFIGDTALIFARNGSKVHAFEPQEDAFFCMEYNCRRYPNIKLYNKAAGNGSLVSVNQNPLNGNLGTRTVSYAEEGIKTTRLDSMHLRVDLLKIDVEGFEPEVLAGSKETILSQYPDILCEVYPAMLGRNGFSASDIYEPLLAMSYKIRVVTGVETDAMWNILATSLKKGGG